MAESRLDLDAALSAILNDIRPVTETETIDLNEALGRVVAEPIDAPVSLPPFRASAMDGYALRSAEASGPPPYRLVVAGASYAGHPMSAATPRGHCVRIFTGAPVPEDLDTVVIQEDCDRDEHTVRVRIPVEAGDNIRPAGHDVSAGSRLADPGRRLTPFDLGWLAACGLTRVRVHRRPTVGIFSTGDELVEPGKTLGAGQIFDANRLTLASLLDTLPVRILDLGIVPDSRARIRDMLVNADRRCDVVVTSGGVSVGDADWVKQMVEEIGHLQLWKLNLKPGKPLAYGRLRRCAFFGLPGNPVSTIVTALMLLKPALERLCGADPTDPPTLPALLRGKLQHRPGREEFQRGTLRSRDGIMEVIVTGDQSSNRLASFAAANCLIRIPKETGDIDDGTPVATLPFRGLI